MANGQTVIQYGEVYLYRCQTRRIEQRPVRDVGDVNLKCWKFVVQGTGLIHGFAGACKYAEVITSPTVPTPTAASAAHKGIRWRLAPRQAFTMAVGCSTTSVGSGQVILRANPMTGITSPSQLEEIGLTGYDVNDGPICTQFDVVHVSADNIFRVEFTFEIHRVQCDDEDAAASNTTGVIAHRWGCVDSFDHNLRTVRTYRGTLELATSNFSPHWFRYLVVPPLQPGMRRDHMDFVATEDGRKLQYTISDTEIAISAPYPARRWQMQHTESTISQDGLKVTSHVTVTLEGDTQVDKGQLIVLGLYCVSAKLQGSKPGEVPDPVGPIFFNDITITDFTGDVNVVTVAASCWRPASEVSGLAVRVDGFKKLIAQADLPDFVDAYDPQRSAGGYDDDPAEYEGAISLTGIFRAYLQSACSVGGIVENPIANNNEETPTEPRTTISAATAPTIEESAVPWYSESHLTNMYTRFQMESVFKTNKLRAAMPIASAPYGGGGIDTADATSVVALSKPQSRLAVRISGERIGAWPEMPSPETIESAGATVASSVASIGMRCLNHVVLAGTQTKSAAGEDVYRASADYVFALLRAPTPTEVLKIGLNPWSTDSATVSTETLTNGSY